ncbi:MAG: sigma-54-dependent Fis family transcriptional regulator [Fibrobacterota bacterium]|nr:sigma-54-dependent Fis family transcriptional regulator [Fibrobacterota bacterium]
MILKNKNSGETHVMAHNVFTAGSGAVNNLMLSGEHVRKIHFQILKQGSQFKLMSMNGTVEINGNLLGEHMLAQGDEIKAGGEVFVAEFSNVSAVAPSENAAVVANPYERLLDGMILLLDNPDKRRSSEEILSLGMELMEADGGFLFTVDGGSLTLLCSVPEDNESYSNSAVNAALKNREALIWSAMDGTAGGAGEVSAQSIAQKNIHSILVSPLLNRVTGQVIGLFYLHRKRPDSPFLENQRKLFAHISQLLGGVLSTNQTQIEQAERIETLKEIKGTGDLVYSSPEMGKVVEAAKRAAASNVPILITGETGTGKDVLANHIHGHSTRQGKPFIAVNCGAIPENLIESELFGHEKGAFTGATALQRGLFEQANGGSLFLDEVGELPVLMQVKFLRVLQTGRIRRVGGNEEVAVDVRVIAATNRDLPAEIREGRFREDLYYRLNLVQLRLPPLRDREGDTLVLATHILKKACASFNMNAAALTRAAEKALLKYTWPGNVRELENKIQKAVLNSSSRVIDVESLDLPEDPDRELLSLKAAREQAEAQAINLALSKARGNLTLAASFLGIDRKVLRDIMERLGIKKEDFKGSRDA